MIHDTLENISSLTTEMSGALERGDVTLFSELLDERADLLAGLRHAPTSDARASSEAREVIRSVIDADAVFAEQLRALLERFGDAIKEVQRLRTAAAGYAAPPVVGGLLRDDLVG